MTWLLQDPPLPPPGDASPYTQTPFGLHAELLFSVGVAVSADGTTMAVGAPNDGEFTTLVLKPPAPKVGVDHTYGTGAVFIYSLDEDGNATYVSKIRPTGLTAHTGPTLFGINVALSDDGNTLAVSAPGDGLSQQPDRDAHGSASVYERDEFGGWTLAASFVGHGGDDFQYRAYGGSLALSGDGTRLLVGAPVDGSTVGVSGDGAVYVYEKVAGTWEELVKIPGDGAEDRPEQFAENCAISSDGEYAVVVSTQGGDGRGGAAYCYKWATGAGIDLEEKISLGGLPDEYVGQMSANIDADGTTICIARDQLYFLARTGDTWATHDSSTLLDTVDGADGYVPYSAVMLSRGDLVFARMALEAFHISKGWIIHGSGVVWELDDVASEFYVGYGEDNGILPPRPDATLPKAIYASFPTDGDNGTTGSVLIYQDVVDGTPPSSFAVSFDGIELG